MANVKNFNTNLALNLFNDFGSQFTDTAYSATVAATTNTTLVVPVGSGVGKANDTNPKFLAIFSYAPSTQVWVAVNVGATPSLTGSFVANATCLNPRCKEVKGGDTINFYSTAGAIIGVEFYAI